MHGSCLLTDLKRTLHIANSDMIVVLVALALYLKAHVPAYRCSNRTWVEMQLT